MATPLTFVRDSSLKTGLLNRILGNDANSAFATLKNVANGPLANLFHSNNLLVERSDQHTDRIGQLESRAVMIESMAEIRYKAYLSDRDKDVKAIESTVKVVDLHSFQLRALATDSFSQQQRLLSLELRREADRLAAKVSVDTLDQLGLKVVSIEIEQKHKNENFEKSIKKIELGLEAAQAESRLSSKELKVSMMDTHLSYKEVAAKVKELHQNHENQNARLIALEKRSPTFASQHDHVVEDKVERLSRKVEVLVGQVATLTAWKEEAIKKSERQENLLLMCYTVQCSFTEMVAALVQDRQEQKQINQGITLLLEKNGIQTPKIDLPQENAAASFKNILSTMNQIQRTFSE